MPKKTDPSKREKLIADVEARIAAVKIPPAWKPGEDLNQVRKEMESTNHSQEKNHAK